MRGDVWCKRHKIFAVSAHFCHETWLQYFKMGNDIIFFKLWSEKKSRTLLKSFLVILKTFCFQKMKKLPKMLKENLFPQKKVCMFANWTINVSQHQKTKKWLDRQNLAFLNDTYRLDGPKGSFFWGKGLCKGHEKRCKGLRIFQNFKSCF